jgi:hypothetical protein
MISIRIDSNSEKLQRNLEKIDAKLMLLKPALEQLEGTLKRIFDVKFRTFDRHRNELTPDYRKWKDRQSLPVGVKTGKTRRALAEGGDGVINRISLREQTHFVYEYGIDPNEFSRGRGYPVRFSKWLEKVGDDLVGLSETEAEFLLAELAVNINKLIDTF